LLLVPPTNPRPTFISIDEFHPRGLEHAADGPIIRVSLVSLEVSSRGG
jgi:hypothetical protein